MPLDEKTKELVAVGAAVAGNCLPCLMYHFNKCKELGISCEDIGEAIEMAKTVKEVPIKKISELAQQLLGKEVIEGISKENPQNFSKEDLSSKCWSSGNQE